MTWPLVGPAPHGYVLYRLFDRSADLLYVGMTHALSERLRWHARYQPWAGEIESCTYERWPRGIDLRIAEWLAIRDEQPRYNTPTEWPMCVPRSIAAQYLTGASSALEPS